MPLQQVPSPRRVVTHKAFVHEFWGVALQDENDCGLQGLLMHMTSRVFGKQCIAFSVSLASRPH